MSIHNLDRSGIVSVLDHKGIPTGTGFFVSREWIITCAHVVKSLLDESLNGTIYLRIATNPELTLKAQIESIYWRDSAKEDVAILRLIDDYPDVYPLKFGNSDNTKGHEFETYGFPQNHPYGLEGNGKVGGLVDRGDGISLIQLATNDVVQGFSGAPIFDLKTGRVVGMVSEKVLPDHRKINTGEKKIR